MLPEARTDGLVVEELADEVLVYDLQRHQAHCLNRTAALVWRRCDGQTTAAQIATRVGIDLGLPTQEQVVRLSLDRLERAHLLKPSEGQGTTRWSSDRRLSRRDLARRAGFVGAMVLLPTVTSIIAPTPVQAASCVETPVCQAGGTACGRPCCAGLRCVCVGGVGNCQADFRGRGAKRRGGGVGGRRARRSR